MRLLNLQFRIYLQNMGRVLSRALRIPGLLMVSSVLFYTGAEAACTAGRPNANIEETTPTSAFTHNADSTVTHNLAGLIWDRCAVGMTFDDNGTPADYADDSCTGTASTYTWQEALQQVVGQNNSGYLGFSDWRLPNERELYSIVEQCGLDPTINQLVFPDTPAGSLERFWSATSFIGSLQGYGLVIHYFVGNTNVMSKDLANHIRLVRGGQPSDDFDLLASQYTVGGTVSGLTGSGLVLQNNGSDDLNIAADGSFVFATVLDDLSDYAVTVLTQPTTPNQTCTVSNGSGTLAGADVANVSVACVLDAADQTITDFMATPSSGAVGGSSTLSASASSGLPVIFGSSTLTICTVTGSTVSYLVVGTCTVTADQAGDVNFNPAPQVTLDIGVGLTDQAITNFVATPPAGVVNGSSALSATGGASGNPVIFGSNTAAVCTVSGSTVSYVTVGTCTVTADQAGNASFNAAPQVTLDITVAKADQTITGLAADPATGMVGGTSTLSATASSGLVVSFGSSTLAVCTIAGSTVSYLTAGTCTVTADQAGDANYNAAPQVTLDISVSKGDQSISAFAASPGSGFIGGSSSLSATASSGLAVTFAGSTPAVCTVAGNTVTYVAAGTCTVTTDQAGDTNYNAAPQVTLDINVTEQEVAIPTLSLWGLAAMFLMMFMIAVWSRRSYLFRR